MRFELFNANVKTITATSSSSASKIISGVQQILSDTPTPTFTPTPTPTSNDIDEVNQNISPIIGGIIGGGFGLLFLFGLVCYFLNRYERRQIRPIGIQIAPVVNLVEPDEQDEEKKPVNLHLYIPQTTIHPPTVKPKKSKREVTPMHFFPTPYIPGTVDAKNSTNPVMVEKQNTTP